MFNRLFRRKESKSQEQSEETKQRVVDDGSIIRLKGRTIEKAVQPVIGSSILELAEDHKVDWASNCRRGTCARCRCHIVEGAAYLTEVNEAEMNRLEPDELAEGYRLGCQTKIKAAGNIEVHHASYF